jgi:hypothetical protein
VCAAAVALAVVACKSSSPSPLPDTFCSASSASQKNCQMPADCDGTLASSCAKLADAVQQPALDKARDCLESGVCGPASCLSRARKGLAPTDSHTKLAQDYCTSCAPSVADCATDFYVTGKKLPGALTIAYAPSVVDAIDAQCTGMQGCAAKFASCVAQVATQAIGGAVDPATASCLVAGFGSDDGQSGGPGGMAGVSHCTAANCPGCCRDDVCQTGDQVNGCGTGGRGCQVCAGDQKCSSGVCKSPCGANTCAGCCGPNDDCQPGTTNALCGTGGAGCTACAMGLACSNKTCIDASCQATCANGCCTAAGCQPGSANNACGTGGGACVDCGYGRQCTAAACVLDPTSLWDFYVSFAVIPDKNKSGSTWNFDGLPDAYLIAYSSQGPASHTGTTMTQADSLYPFWGETPLKGITASELRANLSFEVWNSGLFVDDLIGGCAIPAAPEMFDGSLQDITCPATASEVSVHLYYRINPHK